jgi:hypothetical protein
LCDIAEPSVYFTERRLAEYHENALETSFENDHDYNSQICIFNSRVFLSLQVLNNALSAA